MSTSGCYDKHLKQYAKLLYPRLLIHICAQSVFILYISVHTHIHSYLYIVDIYNYIHMYMYIVCQCFNSASTLKCNRIFSAHFDERGSNVNVSSLLCVTRSLAAVCPVWPVIPSPPPPPRPLPLANTQRRHCWCLLSIRLHTSDDSWSRRR